MTKFGVQLGTAFAALALVACTTTQIATAHQTAEKAMILADDTYIALATSINAVEAAQPSQTAKLEPIKMQAYQGLQIARATYAAGEAIDTSLLNSAVAQAQAVGVTVKTSP